MKRKGDQDEDFVPPKRSRRIAQNMVEDDHFSDEVYPEVDDANDSDFAEPGDDAEDEVDNASTPDTAATTVTPTSGMSPRKRFPSDLKTIRCTWPGCEKAFNRPARLTAHMRSHTNERPFKCPFNGCDKSYLEEKHLKQHIGGSHSDERNYVCAEAGCGKSFQTSTRLRRHQLVHEGQERFRCRDYPPCSQSFRKHQTLQRHIRAEHLKVPAFQCKHEGCPAGFDTASSLRRHVEKEHAEIKYWCEECNKDHDVAAAARVGFATMEQLQSHMKKAHISCTFCDLVFPSRDDMDIHIEVEHAENILENRKTVLCPRDGCGKVFSKQSNLQAHIKSVHDGVRYICGQHDVSSAKGLATWSLADGCGGGFATKANLEKHIRHVHLDIPRPLPPRPDPQSFRDEPLAFRDMLGRLTSTSENTRRNISCSWDDCTMKFAQQAEMQNHLQIHFDLNLGEMAQDFSMSSIPDSGHLNYEIPSPFGSQPATPGLGEEWGYSAPGTPFNRETYHDAEQEWQQDEAEIRRLIDHREVLLDPALRQA